MHLPIPPFFFLCWGPQSQTCLVELWRDESSSAYLETRSSSYAVATFKKLSSRENQTCGPCKWAHNYEKSVYTEFTTDNRSRQKTEATISGAPNSDFRTSRGIFLAKSRAWPNSCDKGIVPRRRGRMRLRLFSSRRSWNLYQR